MSGSTEPEAVEEHFVHYCRHLLLYTKSTIVLNFVGTISYAFYFYIHNSYQLLSNLVTNNMTLCLFTLSISNSKQFSIAVKEIWHKISGVLKNVFVDFYHKPQWSPILQKKLS